MKRTIIAATILVIAAGGAAFAKGGKMSIEQIDANADGAITVAEVEAHQASRFAALDTNGDGALSLEELEASDNERVAKRASKMLERADADDSGLIEAAEYTDADRIERMFNRFDANEDGEITTAELEEARGDRDGKRGKKDRGSDSSNN